MRKCRDIPCARVLQTQHMTGIHHPTLQHHWVYTHSVLSYCLSSAIQCFHKPKYRCMQINLHQNIGDMMNNQICFGYWIHAKKATSWYILTNDDTSDGHTHTLSKWNILAVVTFAWSMFLFLHGTRTLQCALLFYNKHISSNLYFKVSQIPKLKCFWSGLAVAFAQSIAARC